ncbi:hypothetical protein HS088_TW09G00416 [Tripterygium wilfordii]|uniref:VQ domain-containing protein n=1 Tax=Tripterygium wilfordii TaxID=458696 RepID=A0A7J7D7T3_TRIWF|nr:VQ motif-containing protein 22-like [Tripterygium wilfordii]KAF5742371.1 hypothetical protein HS088_TW09G00416 [Tripterygium wilfordii]
MEDTLTSSTDQWVQSYDSFHSPVPFSDSAFATTGVESTLVSPNNSHRAIDHHHHQQQHQLSPKSTGCASKPIRRRSRASKKTPTTLLNANSTNFRALVQQFTGCPRAPISFATQKGPITLNFGAGSANNYSFSEDFREKSYRQHPEQENWSQQNEQQQHQQQYQQQQQQQRYKLLDSVSNDASNSGSPNVEIEDDFVLDDFSLDELTREYLFSNGYS